METNLDNMEKNLDEANKIKHKEDIKTRQKIIQNKRKYRKKT